MKKKRSDDDLRFINWLRSVERSINQINTIISDSQQREELGSEQEALIEKLHKLYWTEEIQFDDKCIDFTKLKTTQ